MSLPPQAPPFSPPSSMIECLVQGGLRASGPRTYVVRYRVPQVSGRGPRLLGRRGKTRDTYYVMSKRRERGGGRKTASAEKALTLTCA